MLLQRMLRTPRQVTLRERVLQRQCWNNECTYDEGSDGERSDDWIFKLRLQQQTLQQQTHRVRGFVSTYAPTWFLVAVFRSLYLRRRMHQLGMFAEVSSVLCIELFLPRHTNTSEIHKTMRRLPTPSFTNDTIDASAHMNSPMANASNLDIPTNAPTTYIATNTST
jgi:hypothetical protein